MSWLVRTAVNVAAALFLFYVAIAVMFGLAVFVGAVSGQ